MFLRSRARPVRATLLPSVSRLTIQCGILNISQPYRPSRTVTGIVLLYFYATHLTQRIQEQTTKPNTSQSLLHTSVQKLLEQFGTVKKYLKAFKMQHEPNLLFHWKYLYNGLCEVQTTWSNGLPKATDSWGSVCWSKWCIAAPQRGFPATIWYKR
jgi:hypothetical protein